MTTKRNAALIVAGMSLISAVAVTGCAATVREADPLTGCYVHAFGHEDFRIPVMTYTGPTQEPRFWKQARSLKIGPHAYLIGYADDRYREQTLDLPPRAIVADLDAIDFHDRVRSFRIVCGDSDPGRAVPQPQRASMLGNMTEGGPM